MYNYFLYVYVQLHKACLEKVWRIRLKVWRVGWKSPTLTKKKNVFFDKAIALFLLTGSQGCDPFTHGFISKNLKRIHSNLKFIFYFSFHFSRTLTLILHTYLIVLHYFSVSITKSALNLAVSKTCSLCAYALIIVRRIGSILQSQWTPSQFIRNFIYSSKNLQKSHTGVLKVLCEWVTFKYNSL